MKTLRLQPISTPLYLPWTQLYIQMSLQLNWYIQYDNKTFAVLHNPKYERFIFKIATSFTNSEQIKNTQNIQISDWVIALANAVRDISQLMYNFFNVQEKLASSEILKATFILVHSVLRVQNLYSSFFYVSSQNFRINRIFASMIRLNRFLQALFQHIDNVKKNFDQTFIQNLDQVYLFILQKIKETLIRTQKLGNNDINIILLDTIALLLRNFGDTTMHRILDRPRVTKIMDFIEKENEVYQEFQQQKKKEHLMEKDNQYFEADPFGVEEDPKLHKRVEEFHEEED